MSSSHLSIKSPLALGTIILITLMATICAAANNTTIAPTVSPIRDPTNPITLVNYTVSSPFHMNMSSSKTIGVTLWFARDSIPTKGSDLLTITFRIFTLTPQFVVISFGFEDTSSDDKKQLVINRRQLETTKYIYNAKFTLKASYIGHAIFQPTSLQYTELATNKTSAPIPLRGNELHIISSKWEGIWGTVFIVAVTVFIIISYINLGAMLDTESMQKVIKQPKTLVLGFIISVLIMPLISWLVSLWLLGDQLLYRVGAFVFACGPAASASTLWTVMLDSDKELSVGLQVASTLGALVTMPLLLYIMDTAILSEATKYRVVVPYGRLMETLFVLLVALFVGWRFVGRNERAQKLARRIFRPLTFSVLFFIIVFSSIIYWYIYEMFDWNIALTSFIITMTTYIVSGLLGHLITFNKDHAIAISISSAYKNSGIAFAVLLVAFEPPDIYIAYVPCLTQVVTTSIVLYLFYLILNLVNYIRRRGQPEPIQAITPADVSAINATSVASDSVPETARKEARSGSTSDKSTKSAEDNDEFIAMNVTDVPPGSPMSQKDVQTRGQQQEQPQVVSVVTEPRQNENS